MALNKRAAVLGAGAWGTALAVLLARNGPDVTLWARRPAHARDIAAACENAAYLPGIALPGGLAITSDLAHAVDGADFILSAIPAQHWRAVAQNLAALLPATLAAPLPVVLAMKGIERQTLALAHEVTLDALPGAVPVLLSGPSFAADVARGLPTAVTLAAINQELAKDLATAFSSPAFRPYLSADLTGVALGGAAKNVLAIACGIVIGAGLGESARAALAARGFAEILRLSGALGGRQETLMGLSGLGDVMLTCASTQSRNMAFGLALGRGADPQALLARPGPVVEGAHTARALVALARRHGTDMPLAEAVCDVISRDITVADANGRLMARPLKAE